MSTVAGRSIRVQSLQLRAPNSQSVTRFRNDLEDALRTATLPDQASGSLIYIRRLNLGRLRNGMSRQALSAFVTKCLGEAPIASLNWGTPAPDPTADIVKIPDLVTAAALALRSTVERTPLHWAVARSFSRLDSSQVTSNQATEVLRQLIAATSAAGPGRIAELKGGLDLLIAVLDLLPEHDRAQLAPPGWSFAAREPTTCDLQSTDSIPHKTKPPNPATPNQPVLPEAEIITALNDCPKHVVEAAIRAMPKWGARDIRSTILLNWVAAAAEGPTATLRIAKRMDALKAATNRLTSQSPEASITKPPEERFKEAKSETHPDKPKLTKAPEISEASPAKPEPQDAEAQSFDPTDGIQHEFAGFWFLIPALRHLACDRLEAATGLPIFRATLAKFATRLNLGEDDVIGSLFTDPLDCTLTEPPNHAVSPHPTVLALLAGQRGLSAEQNADQTALALRPKTPFFAFPNTDELDTFTIYPTDYLLRDPVTGMTLAAQRLITQLLGGRGWRWLVNRPGKIAISPTHIDVTIDGAGADPDIRIAGLDLNPGWSPELGRVIEFHYDYSNQRDHGGWDQ